MRFAPLTIFLVVLLVAAVPARGTTSWRVVAGPDAVRDALGRPWAGAGPAALEGGRLVRRSRGPITRTSSARLYRATREGVRALHLPLNAAGTYAVVLHFAEPRTSVGRGARVFAVAAEGVPVAGDIDVARATGGPGRAWSLAFAATVTDGALDVAFTPVRGQAILSAVEVRRASSSTTPPRATWGDEFDAAAGAPAADPRWDYYVGVGHPPGWGADELQTYTYRTGNVAQTGAGALAITARREAHTGKDGHRRAYTSGRIGTDGRFAFTYGLLSARIRLPAGKGVWPAFWLLGDDVDHAGWPASGEIDVAELMGSAPRRIHGSLHGPLPAPRQGKPYNITSVGTAAGGVRLDAGFHTYSVLRLPGVVQLAIDGRPYATHTPADLGPNRPWIYDKPFRLVLNVAVGGVWDGSPNSSTVFPATMLVDWVRLAQWR